MYTLVTGLYLLHSCISFLLGAVNTLLLKGHIGHNIFVLIPTHFQHCHSCGSSLWLQKRQHVPVVTLSQCCTPLTHETELTEKKRCAVSLSRVFSLPPCIPLFSFSQVLSLRFFTFIFMQCCPGPLSLFCSLRLCLFKFLWSLPEHCCGMLLTGVIPSPPPSIFLRLFIVLMTAIWIKTRHLLLPQ